MGYETLIDEYLAGPELLRHAVAGMSREQLVAAPIPGKWSTLEVICHISDYEPVHADRMKRVIALEEPELFKGDPVRFAERLAYGQRDVAEELSLIGLVRTQMTRILRTLEPEDFKRRGIHSRDGAMALDALLERVTSHIPHHIRFIEEKRRALG